MFDLKTTSDPKWLETVMNDFSSFMIDHAACERKASATALSFTVRYPDRQELVESMAQVAQEELEHFISVMNLIHARGWQLGPDRKDHYVRKMLQLVRGPSEERLMDRLLVFGIVEGRGCERFQMVSQALEDPELKTFYDELFKAEARHHAAFLHQVRALAPEEIWRKRLDELLTAEAEILESLPFEAYLH